MNADAIKEFLFRHFEKFVFGGLTLLAAFLIYQGVGKPDIMAKHQPDKMEQQAKQVRSSIDDDHWAAIKEERVKSPDIVGRTNKAIQPVDPTVYKVPHTWERVSVDSSIKRTDPKLPVPIDLHVTGVIASLAWKNPALDYPLHALEPADPAVKIEKKEKKPAKKPRMSMEEQYNMDEQQSMMDSMMSSGMESGMMDPSMGGMAGKPVRQVDGKLYDQGFRPTMSREVAPVVGQFIAGVALMPQKKIFDEFEKALAQSEGYNPQRDVPYYVDFQMQRADVTTKSVDQLTEADWAIRGDARYYQLSLIRYWAGMAKEIVAGKYRDTELTAAIPPVLLDNYSWFASHPRIPMGDEPLTTANALLPKKTDFTDVPLIPGQRTPGSRRGRTGGAQMMSSGMDSSMQMPGMYNNGMTMRAEQPEFKLIRFYDFRDFTGQDTAAPKPGRKYVYRLRIAIEDPNFPENPLLQPRNATLSADVFKRVETLTSQATEMAKKAPTVPRDASLWIKWSEYSEPSPPVSLPPLYDSYAGPVDPGTFKTYQVDAATSIEFPIKSPKAKVVVTKWDPNYGVPVPVFMDATRGTVVNKDKAVIELPDPVAMEVKKIPDASVKTDNVVVDISGGRPLAISPAENQTEPGVVLMFDPMGGLEVVDEIDTQRGYRLYSFADERGE